VAVVGVRGPHATLVGADMRVGSLFTGYGGLDLAVGGDLEWYAEIEPAACKVLAHHYPGVPNLGDITQIDWATVPKVDVITGGYPCQPFSSAGHRKGANDERHLWPYVRDAIRTLGPSYAILENVRGHLSLGFGDVLADLAEIGFNAEWTVVAAADIGAPHKRERLFIVAHPINTGSQRSIFATENVGGASATSQPAPSSNSDLVANTEGGAGRAGCDKGEAVGGAGDNEPSRGNQRIVADTDGSGTGLYGSACGQERQPSDASGSEVLRPSDGQTCSDRVDSGSAIATDTVSRQDGGLRATEDSFSELAEHSDQPVADTSSGKRRPEEHSHLREAIRPATESGERTSQNWGQYEPAIRQWEHILGRPAPEPTTVGRNGRPRLNPVFVEWMMGLPLGHVTGHELSTAQCLKMLGNGVVPQQAHHAITHLLERTAT
jgi:DNA (cytosine-5)-methyltransferase 1